MTTREKPLRPPQPWKVYHLEDLGKRQGKKSDYLKTVPVLILEKWVKEERKVGIANYVYTKDFKERLEKCGLVHLVPKASGGIFGSLTSTESNRKLTPSLIKKIREGTFWINLPDYEPLLQDYRKKYCKDYSEDYKKLFLYDEEPNWEPQGEEAPAAKSPEVQPKSLKILQVLEEYELVWQQRLQEAENRASAAEQQNRELGEKLRQSNSA